MTYALFLDWLILSALGYALMRDWLDLAVGQLVLEMTRLQQSTARMQAAIERAEAAFVPIRGK